MNEPAELLLQLQRDMTEGFEKVYEKVDRRFDDLRRKMDEDQEEAVQLRRNCQTKFHEITLWIEGKKLLNGHRKEESKARWDRRLAFEVALLSTIGAFIINLVVKKLG
jgi:hypothetical protein